MQQSKNFPYILTGCGITLFMLLFSIVLIIPVWPAGMVLKLPVLIILLGNFILDECKEQNELLNKRGWRLWICTTILVGVVEAVILLVRQFPVEIVICESSATALAMFFMLEKDYLGSIREQMQNWHKHITRITVGLVILPYCVLVVLQVPIAPYVFMVTEAAAVAICMHFLKKYQALLTKEM